MRKSVALMLALAGLQGFADLTDTCRSRIRHSSARVWPNMRVRAGAGARSSCGDVIQRMDFKTR